MIIDNDDDNIAANVDNSKRSSQRSTKLINHNNNLLQKANEIPTMIMI